MNTAIAELLQTYWAVAVGAVFFVAPGYLLGRVTDFFAFRTRSAREQVLWSVALSVPVSVVLAPLLGRHVSSVVTLACFLLIAMAAAGLAVASWRDSEPGARPRSATYTRVLWICAAMVVLLPLLTTDIQIGHRLFQSTVMYDWSVRVPLVHAAMEGGVPPLNPLSALEGGHAAPLRYYYFWYVLAAQLCHLAHVAPRAGLAASTVWAAFDFLAVLFLSLKYLVGIKARLEERCLLTMLIGCVMGLDLLVAVLMLVLPVGLNIEMEWWHPDRSPSWLASFQYAPHHVAGIATCMLGFLAVVACGARRDEESGTARGHWLVCSLVAGVCFAAAVGSSTFVALTFAVICSLWALRAVFKREWITIAMLAVTAVLAYALTRSFLHEMGAGGGPAHAIAQFALRNNEFVAQTMEKHHLLQHSRLLNYAARTPAIALLTFMEFGFFAFVFFARLRRDFLQRRELSIYEQALWAVFCGAGLVAFFASSGIDGPNDLGMHTGMILKLVLLLWATPWVAEVWEQRQSFAGLEITRKVLVVAAAGCFVIGLGGGAYQMFMERSLFVLQETGVLHKRMDVYPVADASYRLYDVREAYAQAARLLPPDAVLQFNPNSALQPAYGLYATRQLAAADIKCGTPFGGSAARCHEVLPSLRALFGNSALGESNDGGAGVFAGAEQFGAVCRELALTAVLADASDPIWAKRDSWVWARTPLYANETVRVVPCGAATR